MMMHPIEQLIAFVNEGTPCELSTWLENYALPAETTARVLAIKLVGWLRSRGSLQRHYPLRLKPYAWCGALKGAIRDSETLSTLFVVNDDQINFQASVPGDVVVQIEAMAFALYRPRLFFTTRG